jgi:SagB-type dehydrogenase family enzyme
MSQAQAPSAVVSRPPHLAVTWNGDDLVVVDGLSGRVYKVGEPVVRALDMADQPIERADLAERSGLSERAIGSLVAAGLLLDEPSSQGSHWSTFELIVQRQSGGGRVRPDLNWDLMPAPRKGSWEGDAVQLPPCAPGDLSFADVLSRRRSYREFGSEEMELAALGSLLQGAAGVQRSVPSMGISYRPHPSGGGRHPLETYVVALRVRDLPRRVYWFDPFDATLHPLEVDRTRLETLPDELGQAVDSALPVEPAAVLVVTAVFARTMWKYENVGLALVYKDTGCLLQTLSLTATSLGLAGCPVQLRGELATAAWLGLDPMEESLVGCFLVGMPPG